MRAKQTAFPKLMVSEDTAKFIDCIDTMQTLYSQVYNALENLYPMETCEQMIETQFYNEFQALERKIQDFLMMSIKEKVGHVDFKEI